MKMQHIPVVDGFTLGPDGKPLSPFARFASPIMVGATLNDNLADGSIHTLANVEYERRSIWRRMWSWLRGL